MGSYKPVVAALRVLSVLQVVNQLNGEAQVGTIHQQTGIDKSTVVRMLETLIAAGFVTRHADAPLYAVTGKTLTLSSSYHRQHRFAELLKTPLNEFRARINWPSDVAFYDSGVMLVVGSTRQKGALSFNRAAGFQSPVFATSLGLAYMAYASDTEVEEAVRYSRQGNPAPWNALVTDPVARAEALAEVRERGFAEMSPLYSQLEYQNKVTSIGVPFLSSGRSIASINVIYLRHVVTRDQAISELLPPLQAVAENMSSILQKT